MIVTSIIQNKTKVYWVKRYSNGHYYLNQSVMGKQFYRRWIRTSAAYAKSLLNSFDGSQEKALTLSVNR